MTKFSKFLEGFEFKELSFKNRIGMTAMTRTRADPDGTPNDLNKEYYVQRSLSAGIIATEAMGVLQTVTPWYNSCTIATKKSVGKWREIIDEIHKNKSYIFAQLLHGGRTVHPEYANGAQPVAPSPIQLKTPVHTKNGKDQVPIPKELTKQEIQEISDLFKNSILNSVEANFDGVEFNAANGYLIDQFLRSGTNIRTDEYGGSIENRSKFLLDLVDMALQIVPPSKIGVKISPGTSMNEMHDDNPIELAKHVLKELNKRDILYVVVRQPDKDSNEEKMFPQITQFAKEHFKNLVISDGSVPIEERHRRLENNEADIANFGVLMWGNPDLADRIKNDWPLNQPDFQYVYSGGEKSYTDIPSYKP